MRDSVKKDSLKLWELIVAQLPEKDAATEWYSLSEIAPLLNLTPHSLTKHCRDLWPNWEGHWRLNYSQAVALIRRVAYAGRKLPSRAELLQHAKKRGGLQ